VEICQGTVFDTLKIEEGLQDCEAIIHLVGIIRAFYWKGVTFRKYHVEATKNMVEAAEKRGIKRFILMSALGVEKILDTPYMKTKREMETMVINRGFDYTIFRPSVIFGKKDQFINQFRDMIKNPLLPFIPVVGKGEYVLQPISVKNVAQMFVHSLTNSNSIQKTYDAAGKDQVTMNHLLDLIAGSLDRNNPFKLHVPFWLIQFFAILLNQIPQFPVTNAQLNMLKSGNSSDQWNLAFEALQVEPDSLYDYLK
jgi:NADH dehydrogenase